MENLFIISLTTSVVILLLLIASPRLDKRYSAGWKYFVWLILTLRLIIPYRIELDSAPITVTAPPADAMIVFRTEGVPLEYSPDKGYIEKGNASENSADYAPVITLSDAVFYIWLAGALIFGAYHIFGYLLFRQRIKPYLEPYSENICICSKVSTPLMIGFFKPTIILPCQDYTEEETEIILKHEMTHWKRHDIWYKLLLIAANAVHWFNPVIYLMVRQANRDLEYSCDDIVIKDMDSEYRKNYALTILKSMKGKEL